MDVVPTCVIYRSKLVRVKGCIMACNTREASQTMVDSIVSS